jgi:hypothetical protein
MSAYAAIGPISSRACQKGVHVLTHYRDDEIRSVMIYGPAGIVVSMSTVWSEYMPPLVMDSGLIDCCR